MVQAYKQALYVDGGVIEKNPSTIGGTWAWCLVENDTMLESASGSVTPEWAEMPTITNNLTELMAMILGLLSMPKGWVGHIYSDSKITLGRVFDYWGTKGIPDWLLADMNSARRHIRLDLCHYTLLQGHPTKLELSTGIGKSGRPVSKYNVWCDAACTQESLAVQETLFVERMQAWKIAANV